MKKSVVLGLLVLVRTVTPGFGQGLIVLDNYYSDGPQVVYGNNVPDNGVSGSPGPVGVGLRSGWTAGLYFALGDVRGAISSDPSGVADPASLGGGLMLGVGTGSVTPFFYFGNPGEFAASAPFTVPGTAPTGGDTFTMMVIAYSGSSYATANYRGHSTAFLMQTSASSSSSPFLVGSFMPSGFSVMAVPEPCAATLLAMGGISMLIFRRRK